MREYRQGSKVQSLSSKKKTALQAIQSIIHTIIPQIFNTSHMPKYETKKWGLFPHPFNLAWLCDFHRPIGWSASGNVLVLSLGSKRPCALPLYLLGSCHQIRTIYASLGWPTGGEKTMCRISKACQPPDM